MTGVRRALLTAALLLGATVAPAAAATPVTVPAASGGPAQLAAFGWLAGGVWVCDGPTLPATLSRIETRYDVAPNARVLRFTTRFVNKDGTAGNGYAGNLYYDAEQRTLRMWYIDSADEITQGPVTLEGDRWSMAFTGDGGFIGRPGAVNFRVDVVRQTNDLYHWSLLAGPAGGWKPVFALDYHRVPEGAAGTIRH